MLFIKVLMIYLGDGKPVVQVPVVGVLYDNGVKHDFAMSVQNEAIFC